MYVIKYMLKKDKRQHDIITQLCNVHLRKVYSKNYKIRLITITNFCSYFHHTMYRLKPLYPWVSAFNFFFQMSMLLFISLFSVETEPIFNNLCLWREQTMLWGGWRPRVWGSFVAIAKDIKSETMSNIGKEK